MGKKTFTKKNATTFQLLHRSQRDPQIHNDEASQRVLVPVKRTEKQQDEDIAQKTIKPVQTRAELEADFAASVRPNEGEAAEYGIYYDDSNYDYMQHLRPTGDMGAVFVEKKESEKLPKDIRIVDLPESVLPSATEQKRSYQDQQALQDSVAGFRPDLDPRIREVLVALDEADALEEGDTETWFDELTKDGVAGEDDYGSDDGWDSDETTRATQHGSSARHIQSEWEQEYSQFKKKGASYIDEPSLAGGSVSAASGRIKHGNGSIGTGFSMSSSALYRTEGLTLLDDRFDRIEQEYIEEEDEEDIPINEFSESRPDFDSILDSFLEDKTMGGNMGRGKKVRNPYTLEDARTGMK